MEDKFNPRFKSFTEYELNTMIRMFEQNYSFKEISQALPNRTEKSIANKLFKLGKKRKRKFSKEEWKEIVRKRLEKTKQNMEAIRKQKKSFSSNADITDTWSQKLTIVGAKIRIIDGTKAFFIGNKPTTIKEICLIYDSIKQNQGLADNRKEN